MNFKAGDKVKVIASDETFGSFVDEDGYSLFPIGKIGIVVDPESCCAVPPKNAVIVDLDSFPRHPYGGWAFTEGQLELMSVESRKEKQTQIPNMTKEQFFRIMREEDFCKKDAEGLWADVYDSGASAPKEADLRLKLKEIHPTMVAINKMVGDPTGATDWE